MPDHQMLFVQPAQVNILPLEILSSIFVTIVNASLYARSIGDESYGTCEYPTLISSVCAHWRRVSIGTPQLWTCIDLKPSLNDQLRNLDHVKLWLKRSKNSPLHLRLGKGGERDEEREGNSFMRAYNLPRHLDDQLASILLSVAPRVHSFTLKFHYLDFGEEVLLALLPEEGQHPIRELALRQSRSVMIRRPQSLPEDVMVRLLEPLHVLHLERNGITFSAIPCRKLVELQLIHPSHEPSLVELAQLLEANPGLDTIVLAGFSRPHIPASSQVRSIKLPFLRSIHFSMSCEFMTWFFKLLAPGPNELDLYLTCSGRPSDTSFGDIMIVFFQKSRVRSLLWQAEGVTLPPLLASLSYVQRIELSLVDFDTNTLAGLDPTTNLLPNLHTVDLTECRLEDDSELDPGLRSLLSLPSIQQIRCLNCGHWSPERPTWREEFIGLIEGAGLAATVILASAWDFEYPSPFQ